MENKYVISVVFEYSKPYYFSTEFSDIKKGDKVVVETIRGIELGTAYCDSKPVEEISVNTELKPIIRKATSDDITRYEDNLKLAQEAFEYTKKAIKSFDLDMNLLQVQYMLDRSKIVFIYVSDNRVDFRELLKDLASTFKSRIELRQIGSRDRAKMIGGLGLCGMSLCCTTFLDNFDVITINMAKNQFLVLNIQKLSGACGKLMCCLKYEDSDYSELRKTLPKVNTRVNYEGETYKLSNINVLTNQARLENPNNIIVLSLDEVLELLKDTQNGNNNQ